MKKASLLLGLFLGKAALSAEVAVSSGTWSAAGVQAGDDVTITGSCENDIADIVLGSLTVTAPSGETIEISGSAFSFGTGGLTRTGAGTVKFLTDVHGTGAVALSQGPTYLYGTTCGLGDSGSNITIADYMSRLFLCGTVIQNSKITASNKYTQTGGTTGNAVFSFFADALENTENHIYAKLETTTTATTMVLYPAAGAKISLHGGAAWAWNASGKIISSRPFGGNYASTVSGELIIADTPISMYQLQNVDMQNGLPLTTVSVVGMKVRDYIGFGQEGNGMVSKLVTTVDWAFNASDEASDCARFTTRGNNKNKGGTIDVGSTKQRFGGFYNTAAMSGAITGTDGGVFYCRQWKNNMGSVGIALNVKGAVSFVKEGTNSLMLAGTANDTTGALKVSEGKLILGSAARFTALSSLVVGADAADDETVVSAKAETPTIVLNHASNITSATPLFVNGAGVVEVAVDVAVTNLTVDGVLLPAGTYSSALCPSGIPAADRAAIMAHFAGAGTVVALDGAATTEGKKTDWTGTAGSFRFNDAGNWSNGVPAENDEVTISIAGETTIDNDIAGLMLKSLAFEGTGSVILTGEALSVKASITSGSESTDATAVTNVIDVAVSFGETMTVDVLGSKRELVFNRIVDNGGYPMVRGGNGIVRFKGDVTGDGDVTLDYDRTASGYQAHTYVYGATSALGGTGSRLIIVGKNDYNNKTALCGAFLHLCGATLKNGTVYFDGYEMRPGSGVRFYYLLTEKSSPRENVVEGSISLNDAGGTLFVLTPKGARTILSGGGTVGSMRNVGSFDTNPYQTANAGSLELSDSPWTISDDFNSVSDNGGVCDLKLTTTITGLKNLSWYKSKIEFVTDWAFGGTDSLTVQVPTLKARLSQSTYYYDGGTVNLNGTKQRIGGSDAQVNATASFTGTEGSELHWKQTTGNITVAAAFNGQVTLVKEGSSKVTLTGTASTSTGALKVADGVLSLASKDAWTDGAAVEISGDGKLDLNFAGKKKMATLCINGRMRNGVWGAVGSGAPNETAAITDTGFLQAGKLGLMLLLR